MTGMGVRRIAGRTKAPSRPARQALNSSIPRRPLGAGALANWLYGILTTVTCSVLLTFLVVAISNGKWGPAAVLGSMCGVVGLLAVLRSRAALRERGASCVEE